MKKENHQLKCLSYASKSGILNYKELGVYCLINQHYNPEYGYSFPSHEYLKKQLNISEPTLIKILNSIEEKGLITRRKGRMGQNTRYYLTLPTEQNILVEDFDDIEETTETIETTESYDDYDWEQIQEMRRLGLIK